jgi:hypothetical protein
MGSRSKRGRSYPLRATSSLTMHAKPLLPSEVTPCTKALASEMDLNRTSTSSLLLVSLPYGLSSTYSHMPVPPFATPPIVILSASYNILMVYYNFGRRGLASFPRCVAISAPTPGSYFFVLTCVACLQAFMFSDKSASMFASFSFCSIAPKKSCCQTLKA